MTNLFTQEDLQNDLEEYSRLMSQFSNFVRSDPATIQQQQVPSNSDISDRQNNFVDQNSKVSELKPESVPALANTKAPLSVQAGNESQSSDHIQKGAQIQEIQNLNFITKSSGAANQSGITAERFEAAVRAVAQRQSFQVGPIFSFIDSLSEANRVHLFAAAAQNLSADPRAAREYYEGVYAVEFRQSQAQQIASSNGIQLQSSENVQSNQEMQVAVIRPENNFEELLLRAVANDTGQVYQTRYELCQDLMQRSICGIIDDLASSLNQPKDLVRKQYDQWFYTYLNKPEQQGKETAQIDMNQNYCLQQTGSFGQIQINSGIQQVIPRNFTVVNQQEAGQQPLQRQLQLQKPTKPVKTSLKEITAQKFESAVRQCAEQKKVQIYTSEETRFFIEKLTKPHKLELFEQLAALLITDSNIVRNYYESYYKAQFTEELDSYIPELKNLIIKQPNHDVSFSQTLFVTKYKGKLFHTPTLSRTIADIMHGKI